MKILQVLASIVIFVIAGLLGGSTSLGETDQYYEDWPERKNVDPHHNWTVKLNQKLDGKTVNSNNAYVVHDNFSKVEGVEVTLNEEGSSFMVQAPEEGYKAGEKYSLFIEKGVQSLNGRDLKHAIIMNFTIAGGEPNSKKVTISDFELEGLIKETLYWTTESSEITKESMLKVKGLNAAGSGIVGIKDLTGLEFAFNLEGIHLSGNQISDISPLTNLENLQYIDLSENQISDISPLINLPNLEGVVLDGNPLSENSIEIIKILEERGVLVGY